MEDSFCKICSLQFENPVILNSHLTIVHNIGENLCDVKPKLDTQTSSNYGDKVYIDQEQKVKKCLLCSYICHDNSDLLQHKEAIHVESKKKYKLKVTRSRKDPLS